jgi:hypothetical protein
MGSNIKKLKSKKGSSRAERYQEIFSYFHFKNHRLSTGKKKLELERILSKSNRDSHLNTELNLNYEV